jgi:hypothetical protein
MPPPPTTKARRRPEAASSLALKNPFHRGAKSGQNHPLNPIAQNRCPQIPHEIVRRRESASPRTRL